MPEVDRVLGNADKLLPDAFAPGGAKVAVADIMQVRETAGHLVEGFDGRARLRRGAAGLRPSLHLLHHPLWPRPQPLGRHRRHRRPRAVAGGGRLPRGGADRRRPDGLWRRPAGPAQPGADDAPAAGARAGPAAAAPVLARPGRDGRGHLSPAGGGAAADAAPASQPAGRRRHDPEAHEAPPFARRRHRRGRARAACGRTWCWAPTSSPASRPRTRRCSPTRWAMWPRSASPGCMSFPIRHGPARPPPACPRCRGRWCASAPACCEAGAAAAGAYLATRVGTAASVLVEAEGRGHDAHFAPVAIVGAAGLDGRVVACRITAAQDDRLLAVAA